MASWHPIMNARETAVGTWEMVGPLDKVYATVVIVRRGPELGYRVTNEDGEHVGYFRTLKAAASSAHTWFTSTRGPHGIPHAGYAGAEWRNEKSPAQPPKRSSGAR
jgi:hypothetical protein